MTFWDWLFYSFLFIAYIVFHGIEFNHLHTVRHFGWYNLWLLQIKLVWKIMYMFLCRYKFSFYWDKCPRLWSLCHMVVYVSFQRNYQIMFQSVCTILHSCQQFVKNVVSLHPHKHFTLLLFILVVLINI